VGTVVDYNQIDRHKIASPGFVDMGEVLGVLPIPGYHATDHHDRDQQALIATARELVNP
jgi:hypothetical protein